MRVAAQSQEQSRKTHFTLYIQNTANYQWTMKLNVEVQTVCEVYQTPVSPPSSNKKLTWNIVVNLDKNTVSTSRTRGRSSVVVIDGSNEFVWNKQDKSRKVSREDNFVVFRREGVKGADKRVKIPEVDLEKLLELGY